MNPPKGKLIALSAGAVLLLVLSAGLFFLREDLAVYLCLWRDGFSPRPGRKGQTVEIPAGEVRVAEFLQILADLKGLPVINDSGHKKEISEGKILITAPIKGANADLVVAILEANRYVVVADTLPRGTDVLRVGSGRGNCITGAGTEPIVPSVRVLRSP